MTMLLRFLGRTGLTTISYIQQQRQKLSFVSARLDSTFILIYLLISLDYLNVNSGFAKINKNLEKEYIMSLLKRFM